MTLNEGQEASGTQAPSEGVLQGESLSGNETFLSDGEQTQTGFSENYASQTAVSHTKMLFLKVVFPLWIISHLIAIVSGYMLFSIRMYGVLSVVMHSLLALGAGVFVYGIFRKESWAFGYGIGYSAFIVLNAWANILLSYIRYFDVIVFTDVITDVLLLLIFVMIAISIYRNKEYFSKDAMFERDRSKTHRVANIATCAILSFGLAVYFYFVIIRL